MENNRLREYINAAFVDAPQIRKTVELKEEIIQNLNDKYFDLINEGKSEEAAYNIAVANVGDLSELIGSLQTDGTSLKKPPQDLENEKRFSAMLMAGSIMLYILSVVPVLIFENSFGVILMFVMVAAATGLIIYRNMTKAKPNMSDDTVVEEFKQWQNENSDKYSIYKSISSAISALGLVLYFVISFATGAWYITWVIFLIIPAVKNIVKSLIKLL